jgi:hypothetical protein
LRNSTVAAVPTARSGRSARQFGSQRRIAIDSCPRLERPQRAFRRGIEIVRRNERIVLPLPGKEARDVAHIFPLQRQRVVFGVTLEEEEAASILPGEDVDARLVRSGQDLIAARHELALVQLVVA